MSRFSLAVIRILGAATLTGLVALAPGLAIAQSSTEMVAGSNDVTTTTPTLGPVTATMQANSDNPTGTTFAAITGTQPVVTVTVSNLQYATSTNFPTRGLYVGDGEGTSPRLSLMNEVGASTNAMFSSLPVVTPGTGIAVATNRAFMIEAQAPGLALGGAAQTGRFQFADITLSLNVPMSNVVLHLVGLGGTANGKTFTAEFELLTAQSTGVTGLSRLSGNNAFSVSGNQINNATASPGASCSTTPMAACGSVQIQGAAISRVVLRVYLRSNDNLAWPTETNTFPRPADAFLLGLSGEVADLVPSFGAIPTILAGETYRGLTATCLNSGPNTSRTPTCGVSVSSGNISGLSCTGISSNALANGSMATCTFDYTAPLSGSGASGPIFSATTGAANDRNGGDTTSGNNLVSLTPTWASTAFSPATPAGICSAVANRLSFSFSIVAGGTEAGSYDLISHSPFSYDVSGKPVFMTASGSPSSETLATTPGALFKPTEFTTAALPTTTAMGTGEIVVITSRVVGRPGSAMSVQVIDAEDTEHDVATIETASGVMLARTPASGSSNTDDNLVLFFTMPSQGYVFLRQYIADYGGTYGRRLDGGCLRTNLVTVKSRTSAASIEVGQTATFTITVTNNGPSNASNIQLTDLMPATLSGVTSSATLGSYNASTGLWSLGGLASGASATLTLTGTAAAAASSSTVTNTTTAAAGDQTDPTTAADVLSASVTVLQAGRVTATKTVTLLSNQSADCAVRPATPDPGVQAFIPGSCVEYVIGLTNPSSTEARDIRMTDVLAAGLTFMGATAAGFNTSDPAYALLAPAVGTACGGALCTVRLDKARLAIGATGQVRIRAVLQ